MDEKITPIRYDETDQSQTCAVRIHVMDSFFDNSNQEKWLTTDEAAAFLKISDKCLLNLCSNGKVRYYKFGRRNRFLESDLRKLLLAEPRGGIYGN